MAKIDFTTPVIFGALCDRSLDLPRGLQRAIASRVPGAVLLPFQVQKRHLKNVLTCMRLMDIEGLIVMGSHRRSIIKHLRRLDPSAIEAGSVDVIARTPKRKALRARTRTNAANSDFTGFNAALADLSTVDLLTAAMSKNTHKTRS